MNKKTEPKPMKMIATDLDGTLLREDKSISDYTRNVLNKCKAAGIKLAFATGRGTAFKVAPDELYDGRITNNGAIAKAGVVVVHDKRIPFKAARPILEACNNRGIKIVSQVGGFHYSNFAVSDIWPWITEFQIVDFAKHDLDAEKLCTTDLSAESIKLIEQLIPDLLYIQIAFPQLPNFTLAFLLSVQQSIEDFFRRNSR